MGSLDGKKLLVTGVLTDSSIAFHAARLAQEEGAEVVLSSFGRQMKLTQAFAKRSPVEAPVVQLDVTNDDDLAGLADAVREHTDRLDGVVHSIGFAPQSVMGGNFLSGTWEDVATALQVSTFSYKSLAVAAKPLMTDGGAVVGLTFDAQFAWPVYDWMGVAKAGLESANRYLARDLGPDGIRANSVSAGPIRTTAAKSIPGFAQMEDAWPNRAPLGWDQTTAEPAARAVVALSSDWFPATTGEIVHVDGGERNGAQTPDGGTRRLVSSRHAKAEPGGGSVDDVSRPLASNGRRQAVRVGAASRETGLVPERVSCSSASRTRQTWELSSAHSGDVAPDVLVSDGLYAADVADVSDLSRTTDPRVRTSLVVGHEPTMAATASYSADPASDGGALAQVRVGVPTATYSVSESGASWGAWEPQAASSTYVGRPS
ncbi:hypothetical protein OY671_001839 [Metschnikowia pulcherrima]|nr:hypothetical protein OY671_001839 [Metschnikowia pulcherrima]